MKTYNLKCQWCRKPFTASKYWAKFDTPTCRTMAWNKATGYKPKPSVPTVKELVKSGAVEPYRPYVRKFGKGSIKNLGR